MSDTIIIAIAVTGHALVAVLCFAPIIYLAMQCEKEIAGMNHLLNKEETSDA